MRIRFVSFFILIFYGFAFGQLDTLKSFQDLRSDAANINAATVIDSLFFQYITRAIENRGYNGQDWTDLAAALTAAAADTANLIISKKHTISANTTWSGQAAVVMNRGGLINISGATDTLFINSPFEAGKYQVFEGSGVVRFQAGMVDAVKPEWFGAKRDGVTDDAVAIQDALNSITEGHLEGLPGVYVIGTALTSAGIDSNFTLSGHSTTFKIKNGVDLTAMFTFVDNNITIRDLTFNVNQANQTSVGQNKAISIIGSRNARILDCTFIGGSELTGSSESVNVLNTDIFIFKGNTSINEINEMLTMDNVDNFAITGNIFSGDCVNDTATPFNIRDLSSNGVMFGNIINCSGGAGFYLDDPTDGGDAPENFAITGNVITNTYGDCILAEQAPFTVVTGNMIVGDHPVLDPGGDSGISLGAIGNLAVGNVVVGKNNVGIALFYNSKPDHSQTGKGAIGNLVFDSGTGNPTVTSRQIWLHNAIRTVVVGNGLYSFQSPNNTNFGVDESGTAEDNLILGNLSYRDSTRGFNVIGDETSLIGNMVTTAATSVDSTVIEADNLHIGTFKQTGDIDAAAFGGYKDILWFHFENVVANTTNVMLLLGSPVGHTKYPMEAPGSILGIAYRSTAVLSAGTAEVNVLVEAADTGFGLSLTTASSASELASQAKDTDLWSIGQRIALEIVTDASFAPTTMDVMVGVLVEY